MMASLNGNGTVTNGDSRISNGDNHVEEVCPTCFKTIYWPCFYSGKLYIHFVDLMYFYIDRIPIIVAMEYKTMNIQKTQKVILIL